MKNQNLIRLIMFFLLLLSSCAKPLISNLEKGTYETGTAPNDILNVSISILPLPESTSEPEKPKTFFDLRDSLPHIFLKIMSTKTNNADTLISLLSKPLSTIEKTQAKKKPTEYTEYKVRFAFSNLKKYYTDARFMHPNTRLEFLTTTLTIPQASGVTIYNIDKLENEFDDIDLGTLSRDQTVSLNAKLAADGALGTSYNNTNSDKSTSSFNNERSKAKSVYDSDGNELGTLSKSGTLISTGEKNSGSTTSADTKVGANAEVAYANSTAIKEAVAVKLRRLRTGFNFSDKSLTIAQRGRPLGDISDNIYVTTTLKTSNSSTVVSLDVVSFDKLYDDKNKPNKASDLLFSSRNINFSPCNKVDDINMTTAFEGAIRAVGNDHGNTGVNALEYDDKVTYFAIPPTPGSPLKIDKNLFCKVAYKYTVKVGAGDYVLKIAAPSPTEVDIFVDDAPDLMLQWLKDNIVNPQASRLTSGKFSIYFEDIANPANRIYVVNSTITPADITKLKNLSSVKAEERKF